MATKTSSAWSAAEAALPGITRELHPAHSRASVSGPVRGIGHHVVLKSRDDLWIESQDKLVTDDGKELGGLYIFNGNSVTSIDDNLGCCEIVSVGDLVCNVKPGDLVFIDFSDVSQGIQLEQKDHFIAPDHVFCALFDPVTCQVTPLAGYAITKRNDARMSIALMGTDRIHAPQDLITDGVPSGYDSDGAVLSRVTYQEIVSVGPPAAVSGSRRIHPLELALLESIYRDDSVDLDKLHAFLRWRATPRALGLQVGDLVPFGTDFGTKLRVRGQFLTLVPQSELLCVINDREMLEAAVRAGRAGKIALAEPSKILLTG